MINKKFLAIIFFYSCWILKLNFVDKEKESSEKRKRDAKKKRMERE
jgi:hypothetical protein